MKYLCPSTYVWMSLKKGAIIYFVLIPILLSCSPSHFKNSGLGLVDQRPLTLVETFFTELKNSNYSTAWQKLTLKSKRTIISDIIKLSNGSVTEDQLLSDFANGGDIAKIYWSAFVQNCDPDLALKESRWELGKVRESYAEVNLIFRKSDHPATLKLYKEEGEWKFGLVESFWTRK